MKISNKVRAEAIEFAGCMATWWASDVGGTCMSDVEDEFSDEATALALNANPTTDEADEFLKHWRDVIGDDCGNYYSAALWAEAQARLLDGWTP